MSVHVRAATHLLNKAVPMKGMLAWEHVESLSQQSCLTYLTLCIGLNYNTPAIYYIEEDIITPILYYVYSLPHLFLMSCMSDRMFFALSVAPCISAFRSSI